MAGFVVEHPEIFPEGTVVKAYEAKTWHSGQTGQPAGGKIAEGTISSGKVEITGLTAGVKYVFWAEVSGKDAYLEGAPAEAAAAAASTSSVSPAIQKLLAWSFDPAIIGTKKVLTTSSLLWLVKVPIVEQMTITNLIWLNVKEGATLTAGKCLAGLYSENGKLLGEAKPSAVKTAMELKEAEAKVALETPAAVQQGFAYVGLAAAGTTGPEVAIATPTATTKLGLGLDIGVATPNFRASTGAEAGTTALPATTGAQTAIEFLPWVALS